ncbi:hypothetical protein AB4J90_08170 [Geobacillus thermodenitrificans]|jgi:hypothetical protein|uniref:hypothetical protein n=1 Tax=Geobacillus thermodenitrificans TaxID=33940 RepID=UPI000C2870A9|nr:hypothetical protein [Geobacillus thermodenitrificans]MED3717849.1 hypothetical protein [Geobacillus thermodenitrificans]MED4916977.1 hypothetical protein [Geobacillus thermodenitrificans]PJW20494.1 hypothetical protein CV632_08120 [Geobacillus thermodenitrificans]
MSTVSEKGINHTGMLGTENAAVRHLLDRFVNIDWLSSLGRQGDEQVEQLLRQFADFFGVHHVEVKWLAEQELRSSIEAIRLEEDDIWQVLRNVPDQFKHQAEQTGRLEALLALADEVPAVIFQHSFDQLFAVLSPYGDNVVTTAVGYMMYIGGMACAWELLSDLEGREINPFHFLISVLERGHWPLGVVNGQLVVI